MAIKILIALAVLIVLLVVVIATRPSRFHVERSATIAAAPENIFARVDDLRSWSTWSPWEKKDPQMKRTFGGPPAGVGSTYSWAGDKNVGEGRMTIEEANGPRWSKSSSSSSSRSREPTPRRFRSFRREAGPG